MACIKKQKKKIHGNHRITIQKNNWKRIKTRKLVHQIVLVLSKTIMKFISGILVSIQSKKPIFPMSGLHKMAVERKYE